MRSAAAAQSSSRSSGHSVTTTAASAPSSASSAVFAISTPCRCASPVRDRVPCRDVRPLGEQPAREDEARRLTHVVGARLEREPEERDPLPAERSEPALELPDDASLLQLVDLDDRVQELEVVARVRRELLERERVLREARAAEADAGAEERRADPAVEADALGDASMTSAPVASHTFAISLMNEMRVTSAAFAASLTISADGDVAAHDRGVDALVQLRDDVAVGVVERADDDAIRAA